MARDLCPMDVMLWTDHLEHFHGDFGGRDQGGWSSRRVMSGHSILRKTKKGKLWKVFEVICKNIRSGA